jgi:hypothetical protein
MSANRVRAMLTSGKQEGIETMKLEFYEGTEMDPFGRNKKIGLLICNPSMGQEIPIKFKSLAAVETAVTELKSNLDEILRQAQAYFAS